MTEVTVTVKSLGKARDRFSAIPEGKDKVIWFQCEESVGKFVQRDQKYSFNIRKEYSEKFKSDQFFVEGKVKPLGSASPTTSGSGYSGYTESPDKQRCIVRQNALTNAVNFLVGTKPKSTQEDVLNLMEAFASAVLEEKPKQPAQEETKEPPPEMEDLDLGEGPDPFD